MPSKTTKRARAAAKSNAPVEKDDGTRWIVRLTEDNHAVYGTKGVMRSQAEHLSSGLVAESYLEQVA